MDISTNYWVSPIPDKEQNVVRRIDVYDSKMDEVLGRIEVVEGVDEFVALVGREDLDTKRIFCTVENKAEVDDKVTEIANHLVEC